ncbi:MAG TPA: hypothetical protein ENN76_03750 [Euryarchaeota archaeon]|nr:hypothetical protein [Euryarchaeota archaeon]
MHKAWVWSVEGVEERDFDEISFANPPLKGASVFLAHVPVNCHVHLLDSLIEGIPPKNIQDAVIPPNSFKHRGIEKLLNSLDKDSFSRLLTLKYPHLPILPMLEFREGGKRGANLGSIGRNHVLMGRPDLARFEENDASGSGNLKTAKKSVWKGKNVHFVEGDSQKASVNLDILLGKVEGFGLSGINDHPLHYIEECVDACKSKGRPLAIHASETVREDLDAILSLEPAYLVHMNRGSDADFKRLGDEGIPVVICPRASNWFDNKIPIKRMLKHNLNLSLGTDNGMLATPYLYDEIPHMVKEMNLDFCTAMMIAHNGQVMSDKFPNLESSMYMAWIADSIDAGKRMIGHKGCFSFCSLKK